MQAYSFEPAFTTLSLLALYSEDIRLQTMLRVVGTGLALNRYHLPDTQDFFLLDQAFTSFFIMEKQTRVMKTESKEIEEHTSFMATPPQLLWQTR